jgi:hypothetical protein
VTRDPSSPQKQSEGQHDKNNMEVGGSDHKLLKDAKEID